MSSDTCLILPGYGIVLLQKLDAYLKISTTHFTNDSVYKDKKINEMKTSERKTKVNHWGRYEIKNIYRSNYGI